MGQEPAESDDGKSIGIHYQRSRHYRTINADGAQFGITPRGNLQFTLFTDQAPLPEYVLHEVTPEGKLGKAVEEVKKDGVIREVAVNVIMDVATAVAFMTVFQQILATAQQLQVKATGEQPMQEATDTEAHKP